MMLSLTNAALAMRIAAFFIKERETLFEKSALCLAFAGNDQNDEKSTLSDTLIYSDLDTATDCGHFDPKDVTEFLKALLVCASALENTTTVTRTEGTREIASALTTAALHFPFLSEPLTPTHVSLLGQLFGCILRNWFATRESTSVCKDWFSSMVNGILGRILFNCPKLFESYISTVQSLAKETISNTLGEDCSTLSYRQILDRWCILYSEITSLLDSIPVIGPPNQEECCSDLARSILDMLSREIPNIQRILLDLLKTAPLELDDFDTICSLLVVWGQLSHAVQTFSNRHALRSSGMENNTISTADRDAHLVPERQSATGTTDSDDPKVLVTSTTYPDADGSCCMTGWSALQTTTKDFSHEKLKSALKNRLYPPLERDHAEDHTPTVASDLNMLHELHRPTTFHSALSRGLLATLEQALVRVRLATAPTPISLTLSDATIGLSNMVDPSGGTRLSLLLQTPVFCTATHGALFNGAPPVSMVEEATVSTSSAETLAGHTAPTANASGSDLPFSPSFTVQSAWMGASGTGAGLPHPHLMISSSLRDFVSLTLSSLVPAILTLLEADKRNWHVYMVTPNTESDHDEIYPPEIPTQEDPFELGTTATNPPPSSIDLAAPGTKQASTRKQMSETSSSLDEDTFYSTVSPLLNVLSQFLSGQTVQLRTRPLSEQVGILSQITEVIMSVVELQQSDFEQIMQCMADCLVLRSLCHVLSSLFLSRYKLSTAAVTDSSQFSANTDLSSQFAEFAKQYDSTIRMLAEHLVDLSTLYCNSLIVNDNLPAVSDWPDQWPGLQCSPNVRALHAFFHHQLWRCLAQTCPAGLARQLMAHVGAQWLGAFAQLFATEEYASQVDSIVARNDAWITLRTAEFILFASSEHVADVVGLNQRNADINLIHSTATLLAQLLLCRHMPEKNWSRLHDGGFYRRIVVDKKPFDFALANWLFLANQSLFPDLPFILMRDARQQTELEMEWELFAASRHFDPIRLLSIICSWEARVSVALLSRDAFVCPTDPDEMDSMIRVMASLFTVCALVPGLEMFHTTVLTALQTTEQFWTTLPKIDLKSPLTVNWPIWLRAILLVLREPLERIWLRFKQLVDWHVCEDEAFSTKVLTGTEDCVTFLAQHQPRTRSVWTKLVRDCRLPCGCGLPKPPVLGPNSWMHKGLTEQRPVTPEDNRARSGRKQAAYDRWHDEKHRGCFNTYLLHGGYQTLAWRAFATDLIQLCVIDVPVGLQLAFAKLDELAAQRELQFRGGELVWVYLVLLSLIERITNEFADNAVRRVQHTVLLEHLINLLESTQEEEIVECKNHLQSHLDSVKSNQWTYPESVVHSSLGRSFQLSQLVRQIQKHALSDLYFLQAFFRCNIPWIRDVVRSLRPQSAKSVLVESAVQPLFDIFQAGQLKACGDSEPLMVMDTIQHLDWDRIGEVNIGLTESAMHALRPQSVQIDLAETRITHGMTT